LILPTCLLKALLAFVPGAMKGLPEQPKKADFLVKVKGLLGGGGVPKFSEIRQHLNNRKPIQPVAEAPAAAAAPAVAAEA